MITNLDTGLGTVAASVYEAFRRCMESYGYRYQVPLDHDFAAWAALGRKIDSTSFEPAQFIQAQFEALKPAQRKMLTPDKLLASWNNARLRMETRNSSSEEVNWDEVFNTQHGLYHERCHRLIPKWYDDPRSLLSDTNQTFECWFRVGVLDDPGEILIARYSEMTRRQAQNINLYNFLSKQYANGKLPGLRTVLTGIS